MDMMKTYKQRKDDTSLMYYVDEFKKGTRVLDDWQRLDGWKDEYKEDLIYDILCGKDIPKVMQYTAKGDEEQKERILDGGHRTRAITEFKDGLFGVFFPDKNKYWWKTKEEVKGRKSKMKYENRELSENMKRNFDKYTLNVTTYIGLTNEEARDLFNKLNHCRPMTIPEVINSHSSLLVDYLRKEWSFEKDGDQYKKVKKLYCMKPKDFEMLNYMKTSVSLFSIIERKGMRDEYSYCEPKNALRYIQSNDCDGLNTQFCEDEFTKKWCDFGNAMDKYEGLMEQLWEREFQLNNHSEAITYFGYINNEMGDITDQDIEKFCDFRVNCDKYKKLSQKYEKELENVKGKDIEEVKETQDNFKMLEEEVGVNVVAWVGTFQNNGSGKGNLKKRKDILDNIIKSS